MHPFTGQSASRPFSNSPPFLPQRLGVHREYWIPHSPLPSNTSNTFFLRFLNQTEITRAKLSPDTRIREFEKKFKSECAKSNHVHPPALRRPGNKVPTGHRDSEETVRGGEEDRS